jgi:hypothetical protein
MPIKPELRWYYPIDCLTPASDTLTHFGPGAMPAP